jgi:acetyltransferase-like isoleucine patch superfamily enzyme
MEIENIFFDKKKLKYCGENVIIGKTVRIRKPEECTIGDGTIIDDFCYISSSVEIGKNCHISSHVSISGGKGKLKIGDFSTISSHCSVHCASSDYGQISLDLPSVPENLQFGGMVENVNIGSFVTIGSHSCVLPGVIIPNGVAFGAYSLITKKDYESFSLYVGIPCNFLKKRNLQNLNKINKII